MGMPISSYTVLKALSGPSHDYEREAARKALEPFNLFAFVLHDPETHPDMGWVLNEQFERLDLWTGEKLLFFALVDPSQKWRDRARERPYYRELTWEAGEFANPANAPRSGDPGITAFSIAHALGIPCEDLPCIVVTKNFELREFRCIKTSPKTVGEQLRELGFMAHAQGGELDERHWEMLTRGEGTPVASLEATLAKTLSDLLSAIITSSDEGGHVTNEAKRHANLALEELQSALKFKKRRAIRGAEPDDEFDRLAVKLATFLAQLNVHSDQVDGVQLLIPREYLEGDSYQMLKTAHRVSQALADPHSGFVRQISQIERFDHTPALICLSKVFEKEANLSIVHWARHISGVALPEFFNRPQPGVRALVQTPRRQINLNIDNDGKWRAPAIGESEHACRQLGENQKPEELERVWLSLFRAWEQIRKQRNRAAHTVLISRVEAQAVEQAMQSLVNVGVFEKFYHLKRRYRGEA